MSEWTTGAAILEQSGAAPGSPSDVAWADECAAAVNAGIDARLEGAYETVPDPLPAELVRAAVEAGKLAYKAREANVDVTTPGSVVDYLEAIEPVLERYATSGLA